MRVIISFISLAVSLILVRVQKSVCLTPNYVQWNTETGGIPKSVEMTVMEVLIRKGEFTSPEFLSPNRLAEVELICNSKLGKDPISIRQDMTIFQAMSLRKQLLIDKIMKSGGRLQRNLPRINLDYYDKKKSIEWISLKYDLPAMAIFRAILSLRLEKNYRYSQLTQKEQKQIIKYCLRLNNNEEIDNEFGDLINEMLSVNSRDREQLKLAKLIDQTSYNDDYIGEKENSLGWEQSLYNYLDKNEISFIREEVLQEEKRKATPDALFDKNSLFINNIPVRWIDCKSYYGSSQSPNFLEKAIKQINRYNKEFEGNGAIVYRLGYGEELYQKLKGKCLILGRGPLENVDNT